MVTSKYRAWQVGQKFAHIGEYCRNELFPITCGICGKVGAIVCESCLRGCPTSWLQINHPLLSEMPVFYLKEYDDPTVKAVVTAAKFQGRPDILKEVINRAGGYPYTEEQVMLVPVPITRWHFAHQGYNQAGEIARAISGSSSGVVNDVLSWSWRHLVWDSITQNQTTRLQNRSVYVRNKLNARSVVLVDDVLTTGGTTRDCVFALRSAGYAVSAVLVLAVTPKYFV